MTQIFANTAINSAVPGSVLGRWLIDKLLEAGWTLVEQVDRAGNTTGTMTGCATSSATSTTITRSGGVSWTTGTGLASYHMKITSGAGAGSTLIPIVANTTNVITVQSWPNGQPDNSSVFDLVYPQVVLKSSGALNSVGRDFYVLIRYSSFSSVAFYAHLFEEYSSDTHRARKYAPSDSTSIVVDPTDNTVTDATGIDVSSSTTGMFTAYVNTRTNLATRYYLDADINGFLIGTPDMTCVPLEVGVFQSVLPASIDPVVLGVVLYVMGNSADYAIGACTREPGTPASGAANFHIQGNNGGGTSSRGYAYALSEMNVPGLSSMPNIYRGVVTAARILFVTSRHTTANSWSWRCVGRGVTALNGAVLGDTLTATVPGSASRTYILCQVSSSSTHHTFIRTS